MEETKLKAFYLEIGTRIRNARSINDISQEVLAEQLRLTRASIINIEKGRHRPSLHLLIEIADLLHIEYTTLIPVETVTAPVKEKTKLDLTKVATDQKVNKSTQATLKRIISSL